jgi:hypothetical protein
VTDAVCGGRDKSADPVAQRRVREVHQSSIKWFRERLRGGLGEQTSGGRERASPSLPVACADLPLHAVGAHPHRTDGCPGVLPLFFISCSTASRTTLRQPSARVAWAPAGASKWRAPVGCCHGCQPPVPPSPLTQTQTSRAHVPRRSPAPSTRGVRSFFEAADAQAVPQITSLAMASFVPLKGLRSVEPRSTEVPHA